MKGLILIVLKIVWLRNFIDCNVISQAISDVIDELYVKRSENFDIITFGDDLTEVEKIVESLKNIAPHRILKIKSDTKWNFKIFNSGVLLFDSVTSLQSFGHKAVLSNKFPKKFFFLTFCQNVTHKEVLEINRNSSLLHYQSFLIEQKDFLTFNNVVFYTDRACNKSQLIEVNRFYKKSRKWVYDKKIPDEFKDFHGCRLNIGMKHQAPAAAYDLHSDMATLANVWGYNTIIIQNIAERLNFKISYNPFFWQSQTYLNQSMPIDYLMFSEPIQYIGYGKSFISETYFTTSSTVMVPPGIPYSSFEKLFLPFEVEVWMLLVFVVGVASGVIFVLQFLPKHAQKFVAGDANSLEMNLIAHSLGGCQKKVPRYNFARFILINFVLFSIVMR